MIERYSRPEMAGIWSDESRYRRWLEIEILACEARAELGLMPRDASEKIRRDSSFDISRIEEIERVSRHDVIAFVTAVGETIGDAACYLHQGLTSSDVLDTALATQMVDASEIIMRQVHRLKNILHRLSWTHRATLMIGRTHGIHAEPTTFGLKTAVWYSDFCRAEQRFKHAVEEIRVGKLSGAVGNFAHLPPAVEERVMDALGLVPEPVATQVVQRDRHAAFLNACAVTAAVAEKVATEIRHLQRTEVLEAEEPFAKGQRGSSAMPHKKNPILCENICGLARLVKNNAGTGLDNIVLWHERDISHSSVERIVLPDTTIALDFLLNRLATVLDGLVVNTGRMAENLDLLKGLIFSQRVLLALTDRGISRDDAYTIVQRNALMTWNEGVHFRDAIQSDPDIKNCFDPARVAAMFDVDPYLEHVEVILHRVGIDGPAQNGD